MKLLTFLFRLIAILVFIILQQAIIVGMGFVVYAQSSPKWAIATWCLCIPMIYLNIKTYKYIMKYGLINFITMNADTSEIDVPKGKRWYDEKDSSS